jgi:hypothetical protein
MPHHRRAIATLFLFVACSNSNGAESQSVAQRGTGEPAAPADNTDDAADAGDASGRDAAANDSSKSDPGDEDDASAPSNDAGDAQACALVTPLSSTATQCDKCVMQACCAEANACSAEPECGALGNCEFGCLLGGSPNCVANCEKDHSKGKSLLADQMDCVKQKGNAVCYADCH